MIRLPRFLNGLRAQLLIPLLAALVLAQIVSLALFFNERRLAVRAALGEEVAGRVVNVVALVEAAPPELHAAILRSAGSPLVRFTLGPTPDVAEGASRAMPGIVDAVRASLGDGERDIRAAVTRLDRRPRPPMAPEHLPRWMRDAHRAHHPHPGTAMELSLSVALAGGSWLNVETRFLRPPLQSAWPSIVAMVLTAIAIVFVVWWAVRRTAAPMRALAAGADRLGRGGDPEPIQVKGPAEVRQVTETFNMMQERLSRHVRERTQMLAALGHDLRSPLTAMRLRIEMIDDDETRQRLSASVDEMQTMVETTLAFAKGVATSEPVVMTDLRDLVTEIASDIRVGGGAIEIAPGESLSIPIRPTALKRALRNVIENAVRYGERVNVTLSSTDGMARIIVDDQGPGLPEDQIAKVFEPFVRLESSRSRETGGAGLGLAIARAAISEHGGTIRLSNRPEGGLSAVIEIPVGNV